ncbi:unnamed protein product [Pleuronectes platessa]|uniref:Uncharacterized protein n=1 Tax=Pleuronectes platessa TaxID=8262 RepID=A0A9N7TQ35_PLEPL|nr:unnamed protein product [Pleuronectes platessa]
MAQVWQLVRGGRFESGRLIQMVFSLLDLARKTQCIIPLERCVNLTKREVVEEKVFELGDIIEQFLLSKPKLCSIIPQYPQQSELGRHSSLLSGVPDGVHRAGNGAISSIW